MLEFDESVTVAIGGRWLIAIDSQTQGGAFAVALLTTFRTIDVAGGVKTEPILAPPALPTINT